MQSFARRSRLGGNDTVVAVVTTAANHAPRGPSTTPYFPRSHHSLPASTRFRVKLPIQRIDRALPYASFARYLLTPDTAVAHAELAIA
jgi:hypothetical protein